MTQHILATYANYLFYAASSNQPILTLPPNLQVKSPAQLDQAVSNTFEKTPVPLRTYEKYTKLNQPYEVIRSRKCRNKFKKK